MDNQTAMVNLLSAIAQVGIEQGRAMEKLVRIQTPSIKQFYVSVPDGGGLFLLQAGTTEINFFEGHIINPDGSLNSLRFGLKAQDLTKMRSLLLTVYGDLSFSLDGLGYHDLDAGEKWGVSDYDFKSLFISAKAACYIKLIAATTPFMTAIYDRYAEYDLKSALGVAQEQIYDQDITKAQVVTLDLGEDYRKVKIEAYGHSTVGTDFTLEASNDGSHWFTVDSEAVVTDYHDGFDNAFRYIRLSSAAVASPGDTVSLALAGIR